MGVLLLSCILFIVSVNTDPIIRQRRGFKSSVADRIAHGFGKRNNGEKGLYNLDEFSDMAREFLSTRQLAEIMRENSKLAQIIVERFVDTNRDGRVSLGELFAANHEK